MPETWVYVVGGIITSVIAFIIAFNLMSSVIDSSQRQDTLRQFDVFSTDVGNVCIQEINNSWFEPVPLHFVVRALYSTDYTNCAADSDCNFPQSKCVNGNCLLLKASDLVKNENETYGYNVCMQLKDENFLRCSKTLCNISMFYMGVLPENEDLLIKVSKILGQAPIKDYNLCIKKTGGSEVRIEKCSSLILPSTTATT